MKLRNQARAAVVFAALAGLGIVVAVRTRPAPPGAQDRGGANHGPSAIEVGQREEALAAAYRAAARNLEATLAELRADASASADTIAAAERKLAALELAASQHRSNAADPRARTELAP